MKIISLLIVTLFILPTTYAGGRIIHSNDYNVGVGQVDQDVDVVNSNTQLGIVVNENNILNSNTNSIHNVNASSNMNLNINHNDNNIRNDNYNYNNVGQEQYQDQYQDQQQYQDQSQIMIDSGNSSIADSANNTNIIGIVQEGAVNTLTNNVNTEGTVVMDSFGNSESNSSASADGEFANIGNVEGSGNSDVSVNIVNPQQFPVLTHRPATITPAPLGEQIELPSTIGREIFHTLEQVFYSTYTIDSFEMIGPLAYDRGLELTLIPFRKGFEVNSKYSYAINPDCESYDTSELEPWDDCFASDKKKVTRSNSTVTVIPFIPKNEHNFVLLGAATMKCSECSSFVEMRMKARYEVRNMIPKNYETVYELYLPDRQVAVTGAKHSGSNIGLSSSGTMIGSALAAIGIGGSIGSGNTTPFLSEQGGTTYYFAIDENYGVPVDFEILLGTKKETVISKMEVKPIAVISTGEEVNIKSVEKKTEKVKTTFTPARKPIKYTAYRIECEEC